MLIVDVVVLWFLVSKVKKIKIHVSLTNCVIFCMLFFVALGEVCWQCNCTKGSLDLGMAYTNVRADAPWRSTKFTTLPWSVVPTFCHCRGFDIRMISADLLHSFHLGTGRDLIGSCMKILVQQRYWPGSNIDKSLARATVQLRRYAKDRRLSLTVKRLSKQNLTWASDAFPEMKCKGYDTYIILAWLCYEMEMAPPTSVEPSKQLMLDQLVLCVWAADSWVRLLTTSGTFLTELQEYHKRVVGNIFLTTYVALAAASVGRGERLWRTRPKLHILHEMVLEAKPSHLNPNTGSTWMDEDWVKRVMKVKKGVHRRTATESCLRRYLLGLPGKMLEAVSSL